jgi:hypothetical protein
VFSADTDEVLQSLADFIVATAASRDTVNDVLSELRLDTVAAGIRVVLAVWGRDLEPRVHALGNRVSDVDRRIARTGRLRSGGAGSRKGSSRARDSG